MPLRFSNPGNHQTLLPPPPSPLPFSLTHTRERIKLEQATYTHTHTRTSFSRSRPEIPLAIRNKHPTASALPPRAARPVFHRKRKWISSTRAARFSESRVQPPLARRASNGEHLSATCGTVVEQREVPSPSIVTIVQERAACTRERRTNRFQAVKPGSGNRAN